MENEKKKLIGKIIVWAPVLTDHQAFTYQELARLSGLPIVAQVIRSEDQIRRSQGWGTTRVKSIVQTIIPKRWFIFYGFGFLWSNKRDIHIFGSAFEDWRMTVLLWFATRLGCQTYIISEPYSQKPFGYLREQKIWIERLKCNLRPTVYRFYVFALRRGVKGVFTISNLAFNQYAAAGIPRDRLFPFGYFIPSEVLDPTAGDSPKSLDVRPLRLVFVGSLIAIKGLSILIESVQLANTRGINVQLDVYGPGDPNAFGFDGKLIRYLGVIPFGNTQRYLVNYDALVVPSIYDGWGVVVNEAICAGIAVICSDQVGAKILVETFGIGLVVTIRNAETLVDKFFKLRSDPLKLDVMKARCSGAADAIQPSRAASYMLDVFLTAVDERHRCKSPWYPSD